MILRELIWVGTTRKRLKQLPHLARREAGEQLWRLQTGREPVDWKPMSAIGLGTAEIRIHRPHEHRVIYINSLPEGIYVLHAFEKKTDKTAHKDIEIARTNYAKIKKKEQNRDPLVEKSSGNVFVDLGYPEVQAINIMARLELMLKIEDIITEHGWTQQEAANILGLTQSRISELINSRSEKFTIDKLMTLLDRLGKRVELIVKPKNRVA